MKRKSIVVNTTEHMNAIGLLSSAIFGESPKRTSWGEGMLVADVELSPDHTMTIYIHKDTLNLFRQNCN